jgi:serine/threonine protein kinase
MMEAPHAAFAVRLVEHCGSYGLFLPFYNGRDLYWHIESHQSPVMEGMARTIARHVLECLYHMHGRGMIHRDVKLENIFLEMKETTQAYLGDFGMTSFLTDEYCTEPIETDVCSAPELFSVDGKIKYGDKVDIWAFGVALYEMLTWEVPFRSEEDQMAGKFYRKALKDHLLSEDACDLIKKTLEVDQAKRLTAEEALKHSFFMSDEELQVKEDLQEMFPDDMSSGIQGYM